jgi:hypothetical protein
VMRRYGPGRRPAFRGENSGLPGASGAFSISPN